MQNKKILSLFLFYKLKKKKKNNPCILHINIHNCPTTIQTGSIQFFFLFIARQKKFNRNLSRHQKFVKISFAQNFKNTPITHMGLHARSIEQNRGQGPVKSNETDSIIIVIPRPDYTRRVRMHRMG